MAQKKKESNEVHSFNVRGIKVTIVETYVPKTDSKFLNAKIVRPYDYEGEEKESTRFGGGELLLVAKAANMAFDWIIQQNSTEPEVDSIEDSEE